MNKIIRILRGLYISFLMWIIISVPVDTYILGGKLKHLFIAVANTTSPSIYSTDGQMNVIIVIVALSGLIIAFHFLVGRNKEEIEDDEENEEEIICGNNKNRFEE